MQTELIHIMQNEYGINVVDVDDIDYYAKVQKHIDKREIVVLYLLDVVEHYHDKIKFIDDQYQNYLICTAGPYDHPKNIVTLDPLVECQKFNRDIVVTHSLHKKFDFLLMPGKTQIWRLELVKELLSQGLLDNSLWSLSNPHGTIVNITEKKMPIEYELPNFDLQKVVYGNSTLNRILVANQYADTRCSIVCETTISNDRVYLTEKTWKPLLGGHPFVAQANPDYHRHLQDLGFRTFSHIWNEDHDSLHGLVNVCNEIKNMENDQFLDLTNDIVTHNMNLAKRQDWIREYHLEQLRIKKIA